MGIFGDKFDKNKLKSNLKMSVSRMHLLRNKKTNLIKITKREVAELLQQQKDESARIKVENIIREDYVIEAFELLELFCDLLQARLQLLVESKTCPHDLKEAVSTLIYAAPRTEIPEFMEIRKQFALKFGKDFINTAMENKDLAVNQRVMFKLGIKVPEPYLCVQYLKEIARENNIEWDDQSVGDSIVDVGSLGPNNNTGAGFGSGGANNFTSPFPQQQSQLPPPILPQQYPPTSNNVTFASTSAVDHANQSITGYPGFPQQNYHEGGATASGYQAQGFNPAQADFVQPSQPSFGSASLDSQVNSNNSQDFGKNFLSSSNDDHQDQSNGGEASYDFDELQKRFDMLKKRE